MDIDIDIDEIKEVEGIEDVVKNFVNVNKNEKYPYIKFPMKQRLMQFFQFLHSKRITTFDYIGSLVNITLLSEDKVKLTYTDQKFLVETEFEVETKNFKRDFVINIVEFYNIIRCNPSTSVVIFERDKKLYIEFFNGEIHLPEYKVDKGLYNIETIFGKMTEEEVETYEIRAKEIMCYFEYFYKIIQRSIVIDRSNIIIKDGYIYATDGVMSGYGYIGINPRKPIVISQYYVSILNKIKEYDENDYMKINVYPYHIEFNINKSCYYIPRVEMKVSEEIKYLDTKVGFTVPYIVLNTISNLFSVLESSTGVMTFYLSKNGLYVEIVSKKNEISKFQLSGENKEFKGEYRIPILVEYLKNLKVDSSDIIISVVKDNVVIYNTNVQYVIPFNWAKYNIQNKINKEEENE